MSNGWLKRDEDVESLQVNRVLAVPGRAVIQDLYVKNLYMSGSAGGSGGDGGILESSAPESFAFSLPLQKPVSAPTPVSALPSFSLVTAPASAPASGFCFLNTQTICIIPLAGVGSGAWLNLSECAWYDTIHCTMPESIVSVSEDHSQLFVHKAGFFKVELNLRIGQTGHGIHCISIGIGVGEELPLRPVSSCLSFGATLDLCGTAVGTSVLWVESPNTILQIYLRDESQPATDANIFQGTLLLTPLS